MRIGICWPAFVAINPRHQVPALSDGDFHLSEATAIMRYQAEKHSCGGRWLGENPRERAQFDALLASGDFLLGSRVTAPDLLCAAELSALDIDDDRETYLSNYNNIWRWLTRMRGLPVSRCRTGRGTRWCR